MAVPLTAGAVAAMGLGVGAGLAAGVAAGVHAFGSRRGWTLVALGTMLRRAGVVVLAIGVGGRRSPPSGVVPAGIPARQPDAGCWPRWPAPWCWRWLVVWAAPAQPILARVRETLSLGAAGRTAIWADARTVARTFPMTGTGLGTFERSMLIYQTTDRRTRTNQAHSQYLQLLAEGGALVTIPCGGRLPGVSVAGSSASARGHLAGGVAANRQPGGAGRRGRAGRVGNRAADAGQRHPAGGGGGDRGPPAATSSRPRRTAALRATQLAHVARPRSPARAAAPREPSRPAVGWRRGRQTRP